MKDYKSMADALCDYLLDLACGCETCPLFIEGSDTCELYEEGNTEE